MLEQLDIHMRKNESIPNRTIFTHTHTHTHTHAHTHTPKKKKKNSKWLTDLNVKL